MHGLCILMICGVKILHVCTYVCMHVCTVCKYVFMYLLIHIHDLLPSPSDHAYYVILNL